MAETDKGLVLIKLHYFLFFGTLGPVLPYLNVIGKQLQISEMVMGTINAILPLAVLVAKPTFGYLIDLFHKQRKILFMILIGVMATGFSMLALIPARCHTECPDSLNHPGIRQNSSISLRLSHLQQCENHLQRYRESFPSKTVRLQGPWPNP